MRALEGIKVLDLTHALAGPFCTYQLSLLGAEVQKIEKPVHGDDFREFARLDGWDASPSFISVNAGKRSITLNIKDAKGRAIIQKMVGACDVLVENQRPGFLDDVGLGWDDVKKLNPGLIYCSISGFGQGGEMSRWPAYDHTIQAISGMSWTGADNDVPSQGRGFSVDCFSGYVAFSSILGALVRKGRTGEGQFIDVAMLDASMVLMGVGLVRQMITGDNVKAVQPIVHDRPTVGPFKTTDGWLWLSGNFQNHFEALSKVLGAPELLKDPRFANGGLRSRNAAALREALRALIAPRNAGDLEEALMAAGAPAARVRTSREALALQSIADRAMLQSAKTGDGRTVQVMNAGFVADVDGPSVLGDVPRLGQDTDDILSGLGFRPEEIEAFRREGIV